MDDSSMDDSSMDDYETYTCFTEDFDAPVLGSSWEPDLYWENEFQGPTDDIRLTTEAQHGSCAISPQLGLLVLVLLLPAGAPRTRRRAASATARSRAASAGTGPRTRTSRASTPSTPR